MIRKMNSVNFAFTLVFCTGVVLHSSYVAVSGYEMFFTQSKVVLSLPINEKSIQIMENNSIAAFELFGEHNALNTDESPAKYTYKLEENHLQQYLDFKFNTNQLWIKKNFSQLVNRTEFILSAQKVVANSNNSVISRMLLTLQPQKTESLSKFCSDNFNRICFWDSITYRTLENDANVLFQKIGDIGPKIYQHLCADYAITYKLLNCTNYLVVKNNTIYSHKNIDRDSMSPGINLICEIECRLQRLLNSVPTLIRKSVQIDVLDKNDNSPYVQDNHNNIEILLDQPHYIKGNSIDITNIIFIDNDSVAVNSNVHFKLINDTLEIFNPICKSFDNDHKGSKSTVFSCKLSFNRTGILTVSPYCVELQAIDTSVKFKNANINNTNAKICLKTDSPVALALVNGSNKSNKKFRKQRNDANLLPQQLEHKKDQIKYPREATIYKSASNYSRVVQPIDLLTNQNVVANKSLTPSADNVSLLKKITDSNVEFSVSSSIPSEPFGITKVGGIIYVKNNKALQTLDSSINVTVQWTLRNYTNNATITIQLLERIQLNCQKTTVPLCAELGKSTCDKSCSFGSTTGKCAWRESPAPVGHLSANYSTCSPDLTTCPDKTCDPLETLTQQLGVYTCLQDCAIPQNILLGHANKDKGIRSAPAPCRCFTSGTCSCASTTEKRERKIKVTEEKNQTILQEYKSIMPATSSEIPIKYNSMALQCGMSCVVLLTACPLIILSIIVLTVIVRQKNSKKYIKKSEFQEQMTLAHLNSNAEIINVDASLTTTYKFDPDSKWEFDRRDIILNEMLGEGEFGQVFKGYATSIAGRLGVTTVAVKMLKTHANSVEYQALISEFQMLQEVDHPNVIKLLGACTKEKSPLIIIEYCRYGSLKNYLRQHRILKSCHTEYVEHAESIRVMDILSFAWQICKGMTYLSEMKLVHRDLAARNVLLAEGKVCKISDFGLTRDIYEDDAYLKKSKDRVPVKWMAPESLADHVYTSKSDVWSFGILAWELVTLAASPYPGIQPQNLYHLLKSNYRMQRPENCSEEIYAIIRSCWADDPMLRPSFKILSTQWEALLGRSAKYLDLENNSVSNPEYTGNLENIEDDLIDQKEICRLECLWFPPKYIQNDLTVDNRRYMQSNVQPITARYDLPRPLIETKTIEQKLLYENDIAIPIERKKHYCNTNSQPNLLLHYDSPITRVRSYTEMLKAESDEENNLDKNTKIKDLSKSKEISFRFLSFKNLNENITTVV